MFLVVSYKSIEMICCFGPVLVAISMAWVTFQESLQGISFIRTQDIIGYYYIAKLNVCRDF